MSEETQEKIGVKIGLDYPAPIVDEQIERNRGIRLAMLQEKMMMSNLDQKRVYNTHGSRKKETKEKDFW